MAWFSANRLAKSFVMLTFLSMGGMLIHVALEMNSDRTSMPPLVHEHGNTVKERSATRTVIQARSDFRSTNSTKVQYSNGQHVLPTTQIKRMGHAQSIQLPPCKKKEMNLVGRLLVNQTVPGMEYVEELLKKDGVLKGGAWRPTTCQALSKVAIIVPYRNRYPHLKIFLRHIHPFLHRQLLDYRIIVVEQNGETQFNRALLLNIGYKEALKLHDFQCFVFHDVDHIPENDRHSYGCRSAPTHMSIAVDKWHYKLPYKNMFGGVSSFMKEHFEKINGFSNKFWGWGGEDDDSRQRFAILRGSKKRMMEDGLNSLKYDIVKREEHPLYTNILVNVDPTAV